MLIDPKGLLSDLQGQVHNLESDLASQLDELPGATEFLRSEFEAERKARRTAAEWPAWRKTQITQIAVAWVLGTVFLRWTEDNGLIEPTLSGPGDRLQVAEDAQVEYYRQHPEHNDGDWLAEQFEVLRTTNAGRLLFDPAHNPLYWVPISHDGAKGLISFWRIKDHSNLHHDFTDETWSTRFLGDLYQDLSEDSKERYSLLQTAPFVESYILDHTLEPALEERGAQELRVIDPACGSGHFLLSSFERLVSHWRETLPDLENYQVVRRAVDSLHGVDINPYAVAIARFRLCVAAWRELGVGRLDHASAINLQPLIACADSLLPVATQQNLYDDYTNAVDHLRSTDIHDFSAVSLLQLSSYDVVVTNPPYASVEDSQMRDRYRKLYPSSFGKYTLTVPFVELCFRLSRGTGYIGQITSSSFMKRRFGKRLIEQFLPSVNLTTIVDTSGIPVPGAGVTTVILFGRGSLTPKRETVRVLSRLSGEPGRAPGPAWAAIKSQTKGEEGDSEWISASNVDRRTLGTHPWTLSSGSETRLLDTLKRAPRRLSGIAIDIGMTVLTGEDEAFVVKSHGPLARSLNEHLKPIVVGDNVQDHEISNPELCVVPNGTRGAQRSLLPRLGRHFWPNRTVLRNRMYFGKRMDERGLQWFDLTMTFPERQIGTFSITWAAMATHPSFVVDTMSRLFKQSAPVVKLSTEASVDDYATLSALLNSSTVAFWLRQNCHSYGSGAGASGERKATVDWENYLDFATARVKEIPVPSLENESIRVLGRSLIESRQGQLEELPDRLALTELSDHFDRRTSRQISDQEEIDWLTYREYGLLSISEADSVLTARTATAPALALGERAFEIALARKVASGSTPTKWFDRHGSTSTPELPAHWPEDYRRAVTARIALIERRRDLALIEQPECKRRWMTGDSKEYRERVLRTWLLDHLEADHLWFAPDMNGVKQPTLHTVRSLADALVSDADLVAVARLWAEDAFGRPDAELAEVIGALVDVEHVPFLAAYRYKPSGLATRAEWEQTWALQRQEDAVARRFGREDVTHPSVKAALNNEIGEVPVPAKYVAGDFLRTSYWSQRGKLDVPKERFVSYPAASRDGDGSLLLGWAGWDHREQAQALAVLVAQRRGEESWERDRVQPLLAGLLEVLPWVHQWHAEVDPLYGAAPGDIYDGFLDSQLGELHLSRAQLADWLPTGRVDVSPLPRKATLRTRKGDAEAPGHRRSRTTLDPAQLEAVIVGAAGGALSNEDIRRLTGLDATGARAIAQRLITEGRLVTRGQRRGMRYLLP